jgi:hypothetical protein
VAGLYVLEMVIAYAVGLGGADRAFVGIGQRDSRAGDNRARRVLDRADDGALRGLRPNLTAGQH